MVFRNKDFDILQTAPLPSTRLNWFTGALNFYYFSFMKCGTCARSKYSVPLLPIKMDIILTVSNYFVLLTCIF